MPAVNIHESVKNVNDYISNQWHHHQTEVCNRLTDVTVVVRGGSGWTKVRLHKAILLPLSLALSEIEKDLPPDSLNIFLPDYSLSQLRAVTSLLYRGFCNTSTHTDTTMESVQNLMNSFGISSCMVSTELNSSVATCEAEIDPWGTEFGVERHDSEHLLINSSPKSIQQQKLHHISPGKNVAAINHNDVEILSESSSLCMDILSTRLDKENLSTKTEQKITPTPRSQREKVQVINEADGAQVLRNYEDREGSSDKDIDALLKDAAFLLKECPEEVCYQTFPQSRRIRTIVSEDDIRTTCVTDEDWNTGMEPLVKSCECNASPSQAPNRRKDSGFLSRTSVLGDSNVRSMLRRDCWGLCPLCSKEFSKKELFQHAARCRGDIYSNWDSC